ncbi:MAG: T9SS type A sorting domain-containing protein [Bacteroidetes bacterium]|nr:T9SS type A sorting domain-containing protein [Bacteroidota bacterium]
MKNKRLCHYALLILLFLGLSFNLKSQVMMYDNFDYPAGDSIIWHNWLTQQTNLTNAILVANEGLSYPGYICSGIGNAASVGTTGQDVFRGFIKQTQAGTTLYMSCLAKVTSAATGDAFITFKESATSPTNLNYRGRVYAKLQGSNIAFGISKGAITAPAVADYTPAIYDLNTTYLLVVKYKIIDGLTNDSAFLFVNPVIGAPEPAPSVEATDMSATDVGLGSVMLRQGTTGSAPTVIVDGVRVAKSWDLLFNASSIATLNDIKVDGSSVNGFNQNIFTYNDTVPAGQPTVTVTYTKTDWASAAVLSLAPSVPGISTITVTSENGLTTNIYTVHHAYAFHTVTVSASPSNMGTVSGGGVYGEGLSATVTATAGSSYMFVNWTQNGNILSTNPVYTFTVAGDIDLVANFVQGSLSVTAMASPPDGGTISGSGSFPYGSTVTLNAFPNEAYTFYDWTENGTEIGTSSTLVLTNVTANHNLVANFMIKSFSISATASPVNAGTVTGGATYSYGSNATLTAAPNSGYIFQNWTEGGNILGTDPVLILTNITSNHTIVGNFIPSVNTFTVTGIPMPAEAGIVLGSGNVTGGGNVTLTAVANQGYKFYNWMEGSDVLGIDTVLTLTNVATNHTIHANFLSTVGLNESSSNAISIYPTVNTGVLHIESNITIRSIYVFDVNGKEIKKLQPVGTSLILNTSGFAKGLYIIKIQTIKGIETKKFLVVG